ncbi:transmembrane protein, putative (macronuclear) [Tetrahymena thermophila SB210]|uniref:Transmembrane protein, putative n=1 Tax=Tetrahymena thermophila (strain SB210) TaxID=312017 RepID=Q22S59_TETTS|nr:transmembrane protein, putative [Tetrahymena thermophila SB210]EAR87913.2 transmembrane protein, putative [Tetrahymena thermophila SB210]|eukprot:XP_001008158.2 transmembrane protein, putative [Tetrahymena thermophila SB210]
MPTNLKLEGKSLQFLRLILAITASIYRISVIVSIVNFIQQDLLKLAIPLIITQLFMIGSSVFGIVSSQNQQSFKDNILRELVYLIPNIKKNEQGPHWPSSFSLLSKVYGHFLEMIYLMAIIIFTEKTSLNDQIVQILNFFLLVFILESQYAKNNVSLFQLLSNVILRFAARSLFLGQFLLCHRSIYFFVFDLIVVVLFISFSGIEELQQNAFTFGYKYDEPKEKLSSSFPENLILPPLSFGIHFIKSSKSENEELDVEKENIFSGIQVIHIAAMILFDLVFNNWEQNKTFRRILHIYLIILFYQFIKSLIWLFKFLMYGPIVRTLLVDCQDLAFVSDANLQKQYFRFKPLQKIINLKFQNFQAYQFKRIVKILMQTQKQFNIFMKCGQFDDEFVTAKSENAIYLYISNIEFTSTIVSLIAEEQYYQLPFQIKVSEQVTQFKEKFLLNEFVQNYQIIPNIAEDSDMNNCIIHFKLIVLQSVVFQKFIQSELHFMPKQIFYDIFDE